MEILWAPWRMEYIKGGGGDAAQGCFMCALPARGDDESGLILARGSHTFVMLNAYPYNNAHAMIIPFRHVARPEQLTDGEMLELGRMTSWYLRALEETLAPQGFNVGCNLGKAAGAGVEDHLHIHVVPRWVGDVNFMPVIGEAKVMPEHLRSTWRTLRAWMEQHPFGEDPR